MGISGQVLGFILSFLGNGRFEVVLNGKFSQEYSTNTGVHQGSTILSPTLFLLYNDDLSILCHNDSICNVAIYADDISLHSKCEWVSDLWQQLELVSEIKPGLCKAVNWCRK